MFGVATSFAQQSGAPGQGGGVPAQGGGLVTQGGGVPAQGGGPKTQGGGAPTLGAGPSGLPTGIGIPGPVVLPAGGGPSPRFDPKDPNVIQGFQLLLSYSQEEILTDNARGIADGGTQFVNAQGVVTTSGAGSRTADLISVFTPSITAIDRTPRTEFGLNYSPSYAKYLNATDQDTFTNFLTATGSTELWQEHLSLNASASISRQFISNQGAVTPATFSTGTLTPVTFAPGITNNQTDVETYTISPTFRQHFGTFATAQLQYLFGSTTSGVISPATQNTVSAALTSAEDFGPLFWQLSVLDSETNQGSVPNGGTVVNNVVTPTTTANTSQRTGLLSTAYALNHSVSLLSGIGYETIRNGTLGGNIEGPFGNFGVGLLGSRSSLTLLYNLRYNGQFVSGQGSFDITPQLRVQGSYNETVTTTQNLLINNAAGLGLTPQGGFINTATLQPFSPVNSSFGINSGLGNAAFRDKIGQIGLVGSYDRDAYALTLQHETRSTTADVFPFNETDVTVTGSYDHELTPVTHLSLGFGFAALDQSQPVAINDKLYNATAGISYRLAETLTTTASYAVTYRAASTPGANVLVNEVIFGLKKDF